MMSSHKLIGQNQCHYKNDIRHCENHFYNQKKKEWKEES